MCVTKMECFNSRSYFYCVNNGINPLTVIVDLSRLLPVIVEGQSYAKLLKELQDRTEYIKRYERAMLFKSCQSSTSCTAQLGG